MKYESQILNAYDKLGFSPRGSQVKTINEILHHFLDEKRSTVVLNADTGTGKSIIGAVVANVLFVLGDTENGEYCKKAFVVVHNNNLVDQYKESLNDSIFVVKGARNYPCKLLKLTADKCITRGNPDLFAECNACPFVAMKEQISHERLVVTNYSWLFSTLCYTNNHNDRLVHIYDEGHTINDAWCSFSEVILSKKKLNNIITNLAQIDNTRDYQESFKSLSMKVTKANEDNFEKYIEQYVKIARPCLIYLKDLLFELSKRARGNATKINKCSDVIGELDNDLYNIEVFNNNRSLISVGVESGEDVNNITLKPIFIGKSYNRIKAKYNLFMSATISPDFVADSLPADDIAYVKADMAFEPKQKPVMFLGVEKLNYQSMKDPKTIKSLAQHINDIASKFPEQKGLVFVTSFKLGKELSELIKLDKSSKIYLHESGEPVADIVRRFKESDIPGILISPSIFEGVDFPDEKARFQIIVKAPYASLSDSRIKHIVKHNKSFYSACTIQTIVQAIGRGIRNPSDYAYTFVLDKAVEDLFFSKQNIWKDQFMILD